MMIQNGKCVVIGDDGVGKTCSLISYTTQAFPANYAPMVFDDYTCNIMFNGKPWNLSLFDTDGRHPNKDDRFERYSKNTETDMVFLIYFDVMNRESFKNVETFWVKEIKEYNIQKQLNTPYILVACKCDLRDDFYKNMDKDIHLGLDDEQCIKLVNGYCHDLMNNDVINICFKYYFEDNPITTEQGNATKKKIKAEYYLEHSALTQMGLKAVFDTAIKVIEENKQKKKSKSCFIL